MTRKNLAALDDILEAFDTDLNYFWEPLPPSNPINSVNAGISNSKVIVLSTSIQKKKLKK
jgi:hypothetical protein